MSRARARVVDPERFEVDGSAHDGRGIARVDGKVVFIEGALPGETVGALRRRRRRGFDEAMVTEVIEASPHRVTPRCTHFGTCGGCALQHAGPGLQRDIKQDALAENLSRIGRIAPSRWLEPVFDEPWRYRRRARLSCRFVEKKGRMLVGFRERGGPYVADLRACEVLAEPIGDLIAPLAELFGGMDAVRDIAQVEVAVAGNTTVLVLRHLVPLSARDQTALREFAATHGLEFHLQPGGYDTIHPLDAPARPLSYRLPAHDVEISFLPTDFIQVNAAVNGKMVDLAMKLLAPGPEEAFLDLFCGLGNFTLPLARRAGTVQGVEGDKGLVARAVDNAQRNGIGNASFHVADLFKPVTDAYWVSRRFDGVLLDPPRAGAKEVLPLIAGMEPSRIVYVSCHPGTLARDAGELVHRYGYRLEAAGIIDMFPHTAHVESIAYFVR